VFSVRAAPRLYNEDSRPVELELRESLKTAAEDDGEEWFVKCSSKFYKCAINPFIDPKPFFKTRTPPNTVPLSVIIIIKDITVILL
jgi:hypothetical protein